MRNIYEISLKKWLEVIKETIINKTRVNTLLIKFSILSERVSGKFSSIKTFPLHLENLLHPPTKDTSSENMEEIPHQKKFLT